MHYCDKGVPSACQVTRQREKAAAELGIDQKTFEAWLSEARTMGWLHPHEKRWPA